MLLAGGGVDVAGSVLGGARFHTCRNVQGSCGAQSMGGRVTRQPEDCRDHGKACTKHRVQV